VNSLPEPQRSPDDGRRIYADGIEWEIYEQDTTRTPGATHSSSLIFSSQDLVRRLWQYPANWLQLSDRELLTLCGEVGRELRGRDGGDHARQ
jgi:hypothetical protein